MEDGGWGWRMGKGAAGTLPSPHVCLHLLVSSRLGFESPAEAGRGPGPCQLTRHRRWHGDKRGWLSVSALGGCGRRRGAPCSTSSNSGLSPAAAPGARGSQAGALQHPEMQRGLHHDAPLSGKSPPVSLPCGPREDARTGMVLILAGEASAPAGTPALVGIGGAEPGPQPLRDTGTSRTPPPHGALIIQQAQQAGVAALI